MGFFDKLKNGLTKTRESIAKQVNNVFSVFVKVDDELFENLEEALIMADIGVETSTYIIEKLRDNVKHKHITDGNLVKEELKSIISEILSALDTTVNTSTAVVFDACAAAKARGADILICDTAGRLHNKKNLMAELAKINRVIERELPDSARETLLVLDATTGQNAVSQAKLFSEAADITGIILTKLDGTAKGGIVISIAKEQNVPVKFVGVGEGIDDLQEFNSDDFAKAIFEE